MLPRSAFAAHRHRRSRELEIQSLVQHLEIRCSDAVQRDPDNFFIEVVALRQADFDPSALLFEERVCSLSENPLDRLFHLLRYGTGKPAIGRKRRKDEGSRAIETLG